MGVRRNESRPVPKVARGREGYSKSYGTLRKYPSGAVNSRKRDEPRPVPPVAKTRGFKSSTPGAGRVSPKPTPMNKTRDGGSTRHRNR